MNFIIYYFDEKQRIRSQPFSGGMEAAEIVAAAGIILQKAVRATINDAQSDQELKAIAFP